MVPWKAVYRKKIKTSKGSASVQNQPDFFWLTAALDFAQYHYTKTECLYSA